MNQKNDDYIRFAVADQPLPPGWELMVNELKKNNIDYHIKEYTQRNGIIEVSLFMAEKNANHLMPLLENYDL
jgi:hypothetical protein